MIQEGYDVIIVDNLYNSSEEALNRIELLSGKKPTFYKVDVTDLDGLNKVFEKHPEIDSVIHFAALKVGCVWTVWVVARNADGVRSGCR